MSVFYYLDIRSGLDLMRNVLAQTLALLQHDAHYLPFQSFQWKQSSLGTRLTELLPESIPVFAYLEWSLWTSRIRSIQTWFKYTVIWASSSLSGSRAVEGLMSHSTKSNTSRLWPCVSSTIWSRFYLRISLDKTPTYNRSAEWQYPSSLSDTNSTFSVPLWSWTVWCFNSTKSWAMSISPHPGRTFPQSWSGHSCSVSSYRKRSGWENGSCSNSPRDHTAYCAGSGMRYAISCKSFSTSIACTESTSKAFAKRCVC